MNFLDKAFFELQLDFARAVAKHYAIPFEEALYKYTSIYTRLIGFSDFDPPRQDHPNWQKFLAAFPNEENKQVDYIFSAYLEYEQNKPVVDDGQKKFGCFSYAYMAKDNKFALHFNNVDPQGNLGRDRVAVRLEELKEMFSEMKREQKPEALVYVTSWLLNIGAFTRLLPPTFVNSQTLRDKGAAQDNGWWGQFVDRNGLLKHDLAQKLRENMKQYFPKIDEYFPLKTMRAVAPQQVFYDFYQI